MKWNTLSCSFVALVSFVTLCYATDIYTVQQFVELCSSLTTAKDINLKADLDFSTKPLSIPLGVKPDGSCVPFQGILNGNRHVIKNLVMKSAQSGDKYTGRGLFCDMKNATIENLTFDRSCNIEGNDAGLLTVKATGTLVLRNVINRGFVTGDTFVGGLVGWFFSSETLTLDNCKNEGTIKTPPSEEEGYGGGLIGLVVNTDNSTITNCKNTGTLNGGNIGGLIGSYSWCRNVTIENSINSGLINGIVSGGLIGRSEVLDLLDIIHCKNSGTINSSITSGGLIGRVEHHKLFYNSTSNYLRFNYSHNTGTVKGIDDVGGFIGSVINTQANSGLLNVINSNNTGNVVCNSSCGGIIGNKRVHDRFDEIRFESTANFGTVTAKNGKACGFVCQSIDEFIPRIDFMLYNSLSSGKVSGVEAYGIFNRIRNIHMNYYYDVSNVGVFAEINGLKKAYTFTDDQYLPLSGTYAMRLLCKNCKKEVQNITKKSDGQYYIENSNTLAIRTLNSVALSQDWGMVWEENLKLIPVAWISFGSPINDVIKIGPGIPLERQMSESQKEKASGYFIVKNATNDLIQPEFDTFNESTQIILCYSMTIKSSGAKDIIMYIENNNMIISNLGILFLCIFGYPGFIDYYDPSVTYELDSIMTKDLTVLFVYKHEVKFKLPVNKTVYVYPRDKFSVAVKIANISLDDYVLKNKSDGQELNGDTVIESDVIVEVSCQVVVEGAYEGSWIVEAGSTLGNISQLEPYFGENYVVVDTVELLVVDQGTVVKKNMRLHVSEPQQEVSVKIGSPVDMTVNVSVGTRLGDISALKPYFVSEFSVVNGKNSTIVYNKDTVVTGDMVLSIVKKWVVVIEITPTDPSLVDESEVERMVKNLAGGAVSVKSKVVDGKVTQLEVTVDSRERADMIVSYLNDLDKGEGCQAEIFCKVVHVHVAGEGGLSQGSQHTVSVVVALVAALFVVLF